MRGRALGRSFSDFISDLVQRIRVSVTLTPDPASGLVLPGLDFQARDWDADRQRQTPGAVLDALDGMAARRNIVLGLALDDGLLTRADPYTGQRVDSPTGCAFDSPFFRAWVLWNTLEDLGSGMSAA